MKVFLWDTTYSNTDPTRLGDFKLDCVPSEGAHIVHNNIDYVAVKVSWMMAEKPWVWINVKQNS